MRPKVVSAKIERCVKYKERYFSVLEYRYSDTAKRDYEVNEINDKGFGTGYRRGYASPKEIKLSVLLGRYMDDLANPKL